MIRSLPAYLILIVLLLAAFGPGRLNAQALTDRQRADSIAGVLWPVDQHGIVNDFDHLFSPDEITRLEERVQTFTATNGYAFAIVTLKAAPGVNGHLDSLGTIINRAWHVGSTRFDDGITIVICAGCREMRISTGLGTAQILPEPRTQAIVREHFLPPFRSGNYFEGVDAGIARLMDELRGKRPPPSN